MRTHNGMRPQDIVVLLKILTFTKTPWQFKDLASQLKLSGAEISDSLNRSHMAGLVDHTKRRVNRLNLLEFICYGLHYVFPQMPGALVNGMPTAHSHPYFKKKFAAEFAYVWPDPQGVVRGLSITPLYHNQVKAAEKDNKLYLLLACIDIIRVGKIREIEQAMLVLKQELNYEQQGKHNTH